MNDLEQAGKLLREIRIKRGLSIRKTADLAGISPTYLVHIEEGEDRPTIQRAAAIFGGLSIDFNDRQSLVLLWSKPVREKLIGWEKLASYGPSKKEKP